MVSGQKRAKTWRTDSAGAASTRELRDSAYIAERAARPRGARCRGVLELLTMVGAAYLDGRRTRWPHPRARMGPPQSGSARQPFLPLSAALAPRLVAAALAPRPAVRAVVAVPSGPGPGRGPGRRGRRGRRGPRGRRAPWGRARRRELPWGSSLVQFVVVCGRAPRDRYKEPGGSRVRVPIGCHLIEGNPVLRRAVRGEPWSGSAPPPVDQTGHPHSGGPLLDRRRHRAVRDGNGGGRGPVVPPGPTARDHVADRRADGSEYGQRRTGRPRSRRPRRWARAARAGKPAAATTAARAEVQGTVQSWGSETMPLRYPPRAALTRLGDDLSMTSR